MPGTAPVPIAFAGASTKIICARGAADIATGYTMMALVYPRNVSAYHGVLQMVTATDTDCISMETSASALVVGSVDAVEIQYTGLSGVAVNDWYIIGISKPSGSATARGHRYKFSTAAWSHADHAGAIADTARTQADIQIGSWTNGGAADTSDMFGVVWAMWNSDLTDLQIESLTTNLDAWQALAPDWWVIGRGASAMVDETGGTGNETSREAGVTSGSVQASPLQWESDITPVKTRFIYLRKNR